MLGYDDAVMFALSALSAGGGIMGKKRKHIDPEMLRQRFGPAAVSKDTIELMNYIINSPQGQKLMADAAESGQQFQNNVNAGAAQSGLAGPAGSSGTGIFASSAGSQAQSGFERALKGKIYESAMPIAAEGVARRQQAYVDDLTGGGYQDDKARMAGAIGNAASMAGSFMPQRAAAPTDNTRVVQTAQPQYNFAGVPAGAQAGANAAYGMFNGSASPTAQMLSQRARKRNMLGFLKLGQRNVRPAQ